MIFKVTSKLAEFDVHLKQPLYSYPGIQFSAAVMVHGGTGLDMYTSFTPEAVPQVVDMEQLGAEHSIGRGFIVKNVFISYVLPVPVKSYTCSNSKREFFGVRAVEQSPF